MEIIISVLIALVLTVFLFMQQANFGKASTGERLSRILQSANYKDGKFQNQSYTPDLAEDVSILKILKEALFNRSKRNRPVVIAIAKDQSFDA